MLKIINTLIALVVLSTLGYSQEVECQNGRCDVVRKVASVAMAPVVTFDTLLRSEFINFGKTTGRICTCESSLVVQIAKEAPQNCLRNSGTPQTRCIFPRFRKLCCK